MKMKMCRFLVFILIGILLFCGFWEVFHFKYAKALEIYYGLPRDTVDVLVVGSSHAYKHIDPSVLYEEEGISSYILGSASQPLWNSYYYIAEALKTQSPKLVIVECYKVSMQKDYADDPTTVKAVSNMKLSANRIEAINNSVEDKTKLTDYYLEFPWFHSRYKALKKGDFVVNYNWFGKYKNYLGYNPYNKIVASESLLDNKSIMERMQITEKNLDYLNRIIRLSKEKGFDLLFFITPFTTHMATDKQPYYNSLADFAGERGIPFINCNLLYDEIGLDPGKDFSTGSHLSITGAEKTTRFLAEYLEKHYHLEDHRGDDRYIRWELNLQERKAEREQRKQ